MGLLSQRDPAVAQGGGADAGPGLGRREWERGKPRTPPEEAAEAGWCESRKSGNKINFKH